MKSQFHAVLNDLFDWTFWYVDAEHGGAAGSVKVTDWRLQRNRLATFMHCGNEDDDLYCLFILAHSVYEKIGGRRRP